MGGPRFTFPSLLLAVLVWQSSARADCNSASPFSSCWDADPLWLHANTTELNLVAPAEVPPAGSWVVGLGVHHTAHPVVLEVPSPDPAGREIPIVKRVTTLHVMGAYGLPHDLELSLAVPLTLHQEGTGVEGITSQSADPLPRQVLRDPRLGLAKTLWRTTGSLRIAVATRYLLVVPLGSESGLASERGFVGAPSFSVAVSAGRWVGGAELGARLRMPSRFADTRQGTQWVAVTGMGLELLTESRLTFTGEVFVAPTLVRQPNDAEHLVPAEWLAGFQSAPFGDAGPRLHFAGGTGIPLSREGSMAVTSPRWRSLLVVRQPF